MPVDEPGIEVIVHDEDDRLVTVTWAQLFRFPRDSCGVSLSLHKSLADHT
jgi:hypothetical protein